MTIGIISRFALMRKMLRDLLNSMNGTNVVLDATSVAENYLQIKTLQPDILLVDSVNASEDLAALRQLSKLFPATRIVLLIDSPAEDFELRAIQAGARGCVSKQCEPLIFQKALTVIGQGQFWISRDVASLVTQKLLAGHSPARELPRELTDREWVVLSLLAMGLVNKDIAARLVISENTVKAHLASTYRKLGVTTRLGAVLHYFRKVQEPNFKAKTISSLAHPLEPAPRPETSVPLSADLPG